MLHVCMYIYIYIYITHYIYIYDVYTTVALYIKLAFPRYFLGPRLMVSQGCELRNRTE